MNDKGFGVRKLNIVAGEGGITPIIQSPNAIQLNGYQVNVSNDFYVNGQYISDVIINEQFDVGIGSTQPKGKLDVAGDAYVGINTSRGVILTSPNGIQYRLIVDDAGNLSTVAI